MGFSFELIAEDGSTAARRGRFSTPHGDVETPCFMPVGTEATVKGITVDELEELGANVVLANTYHLYLRPGADIVQEAGGLHRFMNWNHPILTDSGGFQVFSLADTLKLDAEGLTFNSIFDGSKHRWTPADNMTVQEALGADIIMQLDQCTPYPAEKDFVADAVDLSAAWARECAHAHAPHADRQALFPIVQGGVYGDLRLESVGKLLDMEGEVGRHPGFGIGGYSVGEPHDLMFETLPAVTSALPADRPRYLMGVGNPTTLVRGVAAGVDMFDCVLPTRTGRMGTAFSSEGRLNFKNARFARDFGPVDPHCTCKVCREYSRAYIRHLFNRKEMLGSILLSYHNLHYLIDLMRRARLAVEENRYGAFLAEWMASPAANDY
ncbi:MAG: tRNA guanosine(34) transglycosylase Tgt [Coriobacteriales bacterium]|jgi:queuine tRNA-ribosyltransferase